MPVYLSTDQITYTNSDVTPAVTTTTQAFTYGPNISDFGTPYQGAYAKHEDLTVELGGEIKSSVNLMAGDVLLQMSIDLCPKADEQAHAIANGMMVEVNIQAADGKVVLATGQMINAGDKVSLNNIVYLQRDAFTSPDVTTQIPDTGAQVMLGSGPTGNGSTLYTTLDGSNLIIQEINDADQTVLRTFQIGLDAAALANNVNANNHDLTNLNSLSFNDPGVNEGIKWLSGSLWQIFESPNALTNAAGNLQFVAGSTPARLMTLDTEGNLETIGGVTADKESHFTNGAFADPRPNVAQGAKVSGGLATDKLFTSAGNIDTSAAAFVMTLGNAQYMRLEEGTGGTIFRGAQTRIVFQDQTPLARVESATGGACNISASGFTTVSDEATKKNIELYTAPALDEIKSTPVYQYNYLNEVDGVDLKHTGILLQQSPLEVVDQSGIGVDLYAMVSMSWKAIQELSAKNDALEARIAVLEAK